ncbi:MAG: hypothetical protein HYT87_00185 [Nitrospirae bacterium]|nr:hypothetical protein [Nitrospirota bacterium]
MILVGIDENGYGPKLGPLVATAVAVEVPDLKSARLTGNELLVRDSKKVFHRRPAAYARGESAALEILAAAGHRPTSLRGLVDRFALLKFEALCERAGPEVAGMLGDCAEGMKLSLWSSRGALQSKGLEELNRWRVRGIAIAILPPRTFNELIPARGSKAYCDFSLFMDLVIYGPPGDKYVFGKVGGTRRYTPFLTKYRAERLALIPPWESMKEKPEESSYRFSDGREFRFVRDADAGYAPVAMASIVGKYVRELFMLAENRHFGLEGGIPVASGYPGDPRTKDLTRLIRSRYAAAADSDWIRQR